MSLDGLPQVSVIVPCFNGGRFLRETLESALRQTHAPLEVLVIDDGSTDDSAAIADSVGSSVRTIRQTNQGESVARNRGIGEARGDWVAFLDADDLWHPGKLERQLAAVASHPGDICSITSYYQFGDQSGEVRFPPELLSGSFDREVIAPRYTLLPSATIVRRTARTRFPEWTTYSEDGIYFNELTREGEFRFIDEPLVGYRRHPSSGQRKPDNHIRACESYWRWAESREDTAGREALKRKLLKQLVESTQRAKWKRDWVQFDELRRFCAAHWPHAEPLPDVLRPGVLPYSTYRLKDFLDRHVLRRAAKS